MKTTMRDKVCQLIGKYQYLEDYYKEKSAIYTGFIIRPAEPVQADMCGQFLADLNKLLEEDEVKGRLVEQDALNAADVMHPAEEPEAKEPPARCYMPLEEVLEQPQLRTQMLEDARRDAQNFRQKYNTLEAITPIITGIDAVFGEDDAPCAPQ